MARTPYTLRTCRTHVNDSPALSPSKTSTGSVIAAVSECCTPWTKVPLEESKDLCTARRERCKGLRSIEGVAVDRGQRPLCIQRTRASKCAKAFGPQRSTPKMPIKGQRAKVFKGSPLRRPLIHDAHFPFRDQQAISDRFVHNWHQKFTYMSTVKGPLIDQGNMLT